MADMARTIIKRTAFAIAAAISASLLAGAGWTAGPAATPQVEDAPTPEILKIALPGQRLRMVTVVLRPPGKGPFPLAIINHGSTENSYLRAHFPLPEYPLISHWLLDRSFVVALPLRPGHGVTGGPYFEDAGRCDNAHYAKSGLAVADSIQAVIDDLTARPFVRKSGVLVLGESAGAWGALALASRNPPEVRAVINFAGGRGGHADGQANHNCVPDRLVKAAGLFGRTSRIPTLWLYAKNDSYFSPTLSQAMYRAFTQAGGRADYHLLPAFGQDGHKIMELHKAAAMWSPVVETFLSGHP